MEMFKSRKWNQGSARLAQCCVLIVCSLTFGARPAAAQTDLTGYWVLHVPNGDGTVRDTYFELKQDGASITGTSLGRGPNGTPISGTFEDGKLQF